MSNNSVDVIECISVRGVVIDLSNVSHALRQKYHAASAAVGRGDKARNKLNDIGEAILAEQLPNLAIKYAPTVRGTRAVIERLNKRSQ